MPFISVTRLRLRSVRFLPLFAFHTMRARSQLRQATGFRAGALLADQSHTFWTATAWDSPEDTRRYMASGAHLAAMPRLLHWCDEASVVNWQQADDALPNWEEADARMRREGRASKVRHASPDHRALNFAPPRIGPGIKFDPA